MIDFARALLAAWPEATKEGAGVLWAHFAGETGDGVFCWNHNLGNMKHVKGDGFDYVSLKGVWEGFKVGDEDKDGDVDADDRVMLIARMVSTGLWKEDTSKDHAAAVGPSKVSLIATEANSTTHFRAYPNLAAGMLAFVNAKRNPASRWAAAWAFIVAGDPDGYARELGAYKIRQGDKSPTQYYTASPNAYAAAMKAKFAKWMAADAFERAREDTIATVPDVVASVTSISIPPQAPLTDDVAGFVEVELNGERWLVSPIQIAPVGIGEALTRARDLGFELPSPELVDAIWLAADMRVPSSKMVRVHDGVHMNTPALNAAEVEAIETFVGGRSLGVDYKLVTAFKDIIIGPDGRLGLYGLHVSPDDEAAVKKLGYQLYPAVTPGMKVIQQPFYGHVLTWIDYSQGMRLVRRLR